MTLWPAPINSLTRAEPMNPVAPVTNTRMISPPAFYETMPELASPMGRAGARREDDPK